MVTPLVSEISLTPQGGDQPLGIITVWHVVGWLPSEECPTGLSRSHIRMVWIHADQLHSGPWL